MKRMILMVMVVCLSLTGCEQALDVGEQDDSNNGGGNGLLSAVNSGAFATDQFEASNASTTWNLTEVFVSNHDNICGEFSSSCESSTPPGGSTQVLKAMLFAANEHSVGKYTIGNFDEEDTPSDSLVAMVQLLEFQNGAATDATQISAGHLDVQTFDAQSLSGTYELTADGQTYTGQFEADHCQSLQANRDSC